MKKLALSLSAALILSIPLSGPAAAVTYHGLLTEGLFGPAGFLGDDFVIAGTFAPGFNPSAYTHVYGDSFGNLTDPTYYADSVADGNWRPIGTGTLADATGAFSGSGTTSGIDNLPIYLFLFSEPTPGAGYLALVSSSSPSWRVQSNGAATIDGAAADVFVLGEGAGGGRIALQIPPIPEPGAVASLLLGSLFWMRRRGLHS